MVVKVRFIEKTLDLGNQASVLQDREQEKVLRQCVTGVPKTTLCLKVKRGGKGDEEMRQLRESTVAVADI
jgi:hypothetical protein